MKILLSWLRDFVPYQGTPQDLTELLTHLGLSVESLERIGPAWTGVVIGKVITCEPVAGSDHLSACSVDVGSEAMLSIICGAPNVAAGQTVPVAIPGAILPGDFKIVERKVRGVLSQGMICSKRELGLSEEHEGIMVLPDDWQVGSLLEKYLGEADWLFDLEVTFNRPDCLSHLGVAREVAAKLGLPLTMPPSSPPEISTPASEWVKVVIETPDRCPRYTARVVKGVKIGPSPDWMQNRLKAVGIRPISNVVDITNYVMMELGHPLHAFDYHLVRDGRIIVRPAKQDEDFTTLDNKTHKLSPADLLIADTERGIALAGVMGGLNTEINDSTTDVLIECAVFSPVGIRITGRDRGIGSESSRRFERGVDPEMTITAASRTAWLIQQLAGGEVLAGYVDAHPKVKVIQEITLRPERVNSILGIVLDADLMEKYLTALGCKVTRSSTNPFKFSVTPPSWRADLEREIDLIEEIIRLHGYNEVIAATTSNLPLEPDVAREHEWRLVDRMKSACVELGFREAITWSLIPPQDTRNFRNSLEPAEVINPLSEDLSRLRTSLAQSLLRAVERNINNGSSDVRLFEWGKCFWMKDEEICEGRRLGVVLTGNNLPESWNEKPSALTLAHLRGIAIQIARRLRLDNLNFNYYDIPGYLTEGIRMTLGTASPVEVAVFGRIGQDIASSFGVDLPVWYIEFNGDRLLESAGSTPRYRPLPRYPVARRDLAFLIAETISAGEMENILISSGGELLQSVTLFDIYSGKGIPTGKKSLAYHLTFRRNDRTLSDKEVDDAVGRIIEQARQKVSAELRSS